MKNIYKPLAATFALALIVASPATSITSQAYGLNMGAHDDTDYGERPSDYGKVDSGNSGSTESSQSASTPASTPAPAPKVEDSSSSSNDSNYGGGLGFNADAHDDTDYGERPNNYGTAKNSNDVTVNVPGVQKFRSVMNADHTVYQVYHMGISRASFKVVDAKGNTVAFKTVTLEQGDDELWYENITLAEGDKTKGLTVKVTKGDATYLSENLGVSGIKLNGTVALLTTPETDAE